MCGAAIIPRHTKNSVVVPMMDNAPRRYTAYANAPPPHANQGKMLESFASIECNSTRPDHHDTREQDNTRRCGDAQRDEQVQQHVMRVVGEVGYAVGLQAHERVFKRVWT